MGRDRRKMPTLTDNLTFEWDEQWYLQRYPDIADAIAVGRINDPLLHYLEWGHGEGRFPSHTAEEQARYFAKVSTENLLAPLDWPVRGEVQKTFRQRLVGRFFRK